MKCTINSMNTVMCFHVCLEVAPLAVGFMAQEADIWFLSIVYKSMAGQLTASSES